MASEAATTATITRNLTELGIFWLKIHGTPYSRRGMPDMLVIYENKPFFFEIKQPGKMPTAIQLHRLIELRNYGIVAEAVHGWDEVASILGIL